MEPLEQNEVYGRSPAMNALPDIKTLEGYIAYRARNPLPPKRPWWAPLADLYYRIRYPLRTKHYHPTRHHYDDVH